MRLKKVHWLSALLVFALISGLIVHFLASIEAKPQNRLLPQNSRNNAYTSEYNSTIKQHELIANTTAIASETFTEQKIVALTVKLAELQSQVLRINALGKRLALNANIPNNEFDFTAMPPSGGPIEDISTQAPTTVVELMMQLQTLEQQLIHGEKQLSLLESLALGRHIENTSYLSGRPIKKGWLSSYYGVRKDPFNGQPAMHKGVDFAGKEDAAIIATASGVVTWAAERYGYGNLIEIDHGNGLKTRYGHNKKILVQVGDVVSKGETIAKMGSTGRSTGPHVHYEILRKNTQINPLKYVYRKAK
jgi:murein DD-endopeptidase MepM/ murein hydrolase activator NlpD